MTRYSTIGRPTPLRDAAKGVGVGTAFLGALATFAATWGLLSTDQAGAVNALLATVPGLIGLAAGLVASFSVAAKAEPKVTPLVAPQDDQGNQLTPAGT